jgi:hypothetical protein
MKNFMVLVEKEYLIGHYVPVMAEDAQRAHEAVRLALESEGGDEALFGVIEGDFNDMEAEIETLLESGILQGERYILNTPGSDHAASGAGICLPTVTCSLEDAHGNGVWGRPLVMKVEEPSVSAAAGKDGD